MATTKKKTTQAQIPLILRCHRLMEAFAKSDDERDFYLDRVEGFIVYINLDKTQEELDIVEKEIQENSDRYCNIPKLTFFETKKIMEGFVNEKVYDIDTKEKLLDIIQSKEAREHFLEFIYDHHSELEKWQQYYQERSRIRIIEWLRAHQFSFVFEEDLDLSTSMIEKLKETLFESKVPREIEVARRSLSSKSKTYYSNEALNPRPKRGRPPKQAQKLEMEPQITTDIYTTVPAPVRPFLFTPEISSALDVTFSARFETGQELIAHQKSSLEADETDESLNNISQKLATLRQLSSKWMEKERKESAAPAPDEEDEEEEEDLYDTLDDDEKALFKKLESRKKAVDATPAAKKKKAIEKKTVTKLDIEKKPSKTKPSKQLKTEKASGKKRIIPQKKKAEPVKAKASKKPAEKKTPAKRPARKIIPKTAPKKAPKAAPKKVKAKPKTTASPKQKTSAAKKKK